jgi:hypothetical protein
MFETIEAEWVIGKDVFRSQAKGIVSPDPIWGRTGRNDNIKKERMYPHFFKL